LDASLSGITTNGALTQTGGSYTVNMSNATQSGAVNLSNNNNRPVAHGQRSTRHLHHLRGHPERRLGAGSLTRPASGRFR